MAVNLDLAKKIKDISTVRKTREDVVDYYRDKYPANWKAKLAEEHRAFTTSKSGDMMSKKNIERRFQSREGKSWESRKPSKAQQEEYAMHGEYLPKKPPSAIEVHGNVCVRYADQPCEPRFINVVLEGDEMEYMLETMDMQVIINKYMMIDVDDPEPTIAECPCHGDDYCECSFSISAIEED